MRTLKALVLLVLCSACVIPRATATPKVTDAGAGLLAMIFTDAVKNFVTIHDISFAYYEMPNGKVRYWLTLLYKDDTESGDHGNLYRAIAMCQVVAEKGKIDLAEVEMRPIKGEVNLRASVVASFADDPTAASNWVELFIGKTKLTPAQKRSAMRWMNSWNVRLFDPKWKDPRIRLKTPMAK